MLKNTSAPSVISTMVLLALAVLLPGCGSRIEPVQRTSVGEHVGEVRGEHTVGQTFVAQHDGLEAVDVLLATFARQNTHPVTFHLRTDPQSAVDLRTVRVSAGEIDDNAYHRFHFEPIPDSHHQRYFFFIDSPESQPGDAITAWIGPAGAYREGSLYLSGQARDGQLAFKLGYSNASIALGLLRDLLKAIPSVLASVALFVLPGLALLLWLAPAWKWDRLLTLIVATGISVALFPLLLLYARPLGLRWNRASVWIFLLLCLALVVWRLRQLHAKGLVQVSWPRWRAILRLPSLETWLLLTVLALVLGVRWLVVRPLSVPMWGDSHQHTYIVQLLIENGGLFDSWAPYSPHNSLTVHFGFHVATAFFHWATGVEVMRSVILAGQIFNGLAVLALYPLAVRISGKRQRQVEHRTEPGGGVGQGGKWAGIVSVLVAGLLMPMPMEYVNWGRYSQLAGQMILPVALWLLWYTADQQGANGWKGAILAAVATAGMSLTYYRMPYYFAAFVLAWLVFYCWAEWRGDKRRWFDLVRRGILMVAVFLGLILPWGSNLAGGRLTTSVVRGVSGTPPWERIRADYLLWRDIDRYVPVYLCALFLVAVAWSVVRRRWTATLLALWTIVLASLVAAQLIRLPGASHLQSFAILIALYIPVGLMVGWLAGQLIAYLTRHWKTLGVAGVTFFLLGSALLGFRQRMAVVKPAYALVNRADEVAMEWIRNNTPSDARFLVNGFLIYGGRYAAGSDAGWWIPFLARRENTMPPQYALFNETEAVQGYNQAVVQLVADLQISPPTTPAGLEKLCQHGVTHVYIGQGQGKVALERLTPYLIPADLEASPFFEQIYHQDRVWIFSLKDDACS